MIAVVIRKHVSLSVVLLTTCAVYAEDADEQRRTAKATLFEQLDKYVPARAKLVVSINFDAVRESDAFAHWKKGGSGNIPEQRAILERKYGIPLNAVTRFTEVADYERAHPGHRASLGIIQTNRALVAADIVALRKEKLQLRYDRLNIKEEYQKVTSQKVKIQDETLFGLTMTVPHKQTEYLCFPDDRTLLSEDLNGSDGQFIKGILSKNKPKPSKPLREALGRMRASDMVSVGFDISKLSAEENEPLFTVLHGNGPLPKDVGHPQFLTLRIFGRKEVKLSLEIQCWDAAGAKRIELMIRDFVKPQNQPPFAKIPEKYLRLLESMKMSVKQNEFRAELTIPSNQYEAIWSECDCSPGA